MSRAEKPLIDCVAALKRERCQIRYAPFLKEMRHGQFDDALTNKSHLVFLDLR